MRSEVGSRLVLGWWHSDDPTYAALIRDGFDPFWDAPWLMGIVNRDPEEVRAGMPPSALRGSNWVPPANWTERCPGCGARNPGQTYWCWFCARGFEHGSEKAVCPSCDTTLLESAPGRSREMLVICPGCGFGVVFPGYHGGTGSS